MTSIYVASSLPASNLWNSAVQCSLCDYKYNINRAAMSQQVSQPQYKPVYYLQRPNSPKNMMSHTNSAKNISLTMSIGANQAPSNFLPSYKTKQELPNTYASESNIPLQKGDKQLENQLKIIFKQNVTLREENENLRRQLQKLKKQPTSTSASAFENVRSSEKYQSTSPQSFNDLRGTIKKQMGELKEMRIKLDMLSKQCKMYEEIIDKMDERIKKLTHDNNKKNAQIDELQGELARLDQLKEKTNSVMRLYSDLESKFNDHQLEWMKWKQNWLAERESYLEKIRELQGRRKE